jgi:hypothetical protein
VAERPAVELSPAGAESLRVRWDPGWPGELAVDGPAPWELGDSLDWTRIELVRVLTASFEDGSVLLLAALRPPGAAGHGEESVAARLGSGGGDPEPVEALISTEYGAGGTPARLGLELYREDAEVPLRAAGDALESASGDRDGARRDAVALEMRLDGTPGRGLYEIIRAP